MLQRIMAGVRQFLGMPDYKSYVEHLRTHHPEHRVPSEQEFYEQYLARRYGGGTSRCC